MAFFLVHATHLRRLTSSDCPHLQWVFLWLWCRCLLDLSTQLSFCVPKNKCSGFIQAGVSHLCSTKRSVGISPLLTSHETLCVFIVRLLTVIAVYPSLSAYSVDKKQPVFGSQTAILSRRNFSAFKSNIFFFLRCQLALLYFLHPFLRKDRGISSSTLLPGKSCGFC